jgi:nucleotide-binding universal stress UspA family protein
MPTNYRKESLMYEKILIATDGSELANKAVAHGTKLAKEVDASVVFVTVTETWSPYVMAASLEKGDPNPIKHFEASAEKSANEILTVAKAAAESVGVKFETVHVSNSTPAEGIIETAEKTGCDLIAMASHGRRGLDRMLLGSQTAEVLAFSKLPVLVIR